MAGRGKSKTTCTRQSQRTNNNTENISYYESDYEDSLSEPDTDNNNTEEHSEGTTPELGKEDDSLLSGNGTNNLLDDTNLISFTQSQLVGSTQNSHKNENEIISCKKCDKNGEETYCLQCHYCKEYYCIVCVEFSLSELKQTEENEATRLDQFKLKCTKCREDIEKLRKETKQQLRDYEKKKADKTKKAPSKEVENLKKEYEEKIKKLTEENTIIKERLEIKKASEKINEKANEGETEAKKHNPDPEIKNDRKHTNGEINEDENENENEETKYPKIQKCINKGFEMCKKRDQCTNETIEVGIECKKLHIEKVVYEKAKEKADKEKVNENNSKKIKFETQYCMYNLDNTCKFMDRCLKIHVTPREYKKTIKCKYFGKEGCREGKWCEYKHQINVPCKFYQSGSCRRGDMCTYKHIDLASEGTSPETSKISHEEQNQNQGNESQSEPNFPEDSRAVDQTEEKVALILKSDDFLKLVVTAVRNGIREKI